MGHEYKTNRRPRRIVRWTRLHNFGRRLDGAATAKVVDAAIEAGIIFFDTADIYGGTKTEEFLAHALGKRRDDVIIATKFGMTVDDGRKGAQLRAAR